MLRGTYKVKLGVTGSDAEFRSIYEPTDPNYSSILITTRGLRLTASDLQDALNALVRADTYNRANPDQFESN